MVEGESLAVHELRAADLRIIDGTYPPNTDFDTHVHEEAFLCLPVGGSFGEWSGRGAHRAVPTGRPIVYEAGSRHAVRTGRGPLRIVHVTDPAERDWSDLHPLAAGLLWQIMASLDTPEDDARTLHLDALACELACPTAGGAGREGVPGGDRDWLDGLRDRLRETLATSVSLTALAAESDRHPAHVARAFRQRWGVTPGGYLRRLRVAAAVTALTASEEPLSSIALDAGFADQSHMGRWLRRYTGRTPGEVRAGAQRPARTGRR